PHMFLNELRLYINYLKDLIQESAKPFDEKQRNFLKKFHHNLCNGIAYYFELFSRTEKRWMGIEDQIHAELSALQKELEKLVLTNLDPLKA
ncbi:MAG TPA: hypothetical protein VGB10_03320, partial [Bacteroidota bacterium]